MISLGIGILVWLGIFNFYCFFHKGITTDEIIGLMFIDTLLSFAVFLILFGIFGR